MMTRTEKKESGMANEHVDYFFAAFDMHLSMEKPAHVALQHAAEDYAQVYHSKDEFTELARASRVVLKRMEESGELYEKTYVLCKLGQIGSMTFEEVMQACGEQDRDKLVEYASKYHFDVMIDPESVGYYRGLVIYECAWGEYPYEYWGTSEG
jgi:hypothetical protein